jgi:hypothetical protein
MPIINMVYKKKKGWKPWANTIAYYPFKTDFNEWSWKSWLDIAEKSWVSISQYWYALFSNWYCMFWDWADIENSKTISMWVFRSSNNCYLIKWRYANQYIFIDNWYCYIPAWQIQGTYIPDNTWLYLVFIEWDTNMDVYINWQFAWSWGKGGLQYKWTFLSNRDSGDRFSWRISELIFEDKIWTAEEISNYYNLTKSNYGL